MASQQRRVEEAQNWLDMARCRLALEDYNRFRTYVKTLKTLKNVTCDGRNVLKELAQLLWQASFPEGKRRQEEWLIAFSPNLPVVVRGLWHDIVAKAAPGLQESTRRPRDALHGTPADGSAKPLLHRLEPSVLPSGVSSVTTDEIRTVTSKVACDNATECIESSSNSFGAEEVETVDVEKTKPDEPNEHAWKASVAALEVMSRRIPWRPSPQGSEVRSSVVGELKDHRVKQSHSAELRPPVVGELQAREVQQVQSAEVAAHSPENEPLFVHELQVQQGPSGNVERTESRKDNIPPKIDASLHAGGQPDDNGNAKSHHEDRMDTSIGGPSDCLHPDGIEKDSRVAGSPHNEFDASDSDSVEIADDPACLRKRLREEEFEELAHEVVKLRQRMVCVFCRDFPSKPKVSALCGHFGCTDCWESWMVCRFECPVCRAKARPQNLIRLRGYWNDG